MRRPALSHYRAICSGLVALLLTAAAQAQSSLPANGTVSINVPAVPAGEAALSFGFFVDVPANARRVTLQLESQDAARNVDLFVRIGSDFPEEIAGTQELLDATDFLSRSLGPSESLVLAEFSVSRLPGNQIFIGLLAFEGEESSANLTINASAQPVGNVPVLVDFEDADGRTADCDTAPWFDTTPLTPGGGNPATTLGEARRNGMLEAARLLSQDLYSDVPVTINACWANRGGDNGGAALAGARTTALIDNTPGLPRADLLYVQGAVTRRAGTSLSGLTGEERDTNADVFISFNTDVDGPEALGDRGFFYGFDGNANVDNEIDFVSVAIHEITHGLGFASTITEGGSLFFDEPDVFTSFLVDNRNNEAIVLSDPGVSDAQRQAAATSVSGLQWIGPESSISIRNQEAVRNDAYINMHAPLEYDPGSSVSHVAQNYCELMTPNSTVCIDSPFRSLALSRPILHEVGWAPGPDEPNFVGLMFDRERNGHGFEFALAGQDAAGKDVYVLTFYSFETLGGAPEWYQAVGTIENGVFSGTRNEDRIGFAQFNYDDGRQPPQQADPDAIGQVVLNFNRPERSTACNDGADRSNAGSLAVLQFVLTRQVTEWCVEPLTSESTRPTADFGGLWFAGEADTGWGFSLENIENGDGTTSIFVLLYVYAEDGTPVWFFGLDSFSDLSQPLQFEMFHRRGFPRLARNGNLSDESAGTFSLTLAEPSSSLTAGNRVSVDVTYQGPEGGSWQRDDVAIQRLSLPR